MPAPTITGKDPAASASNVTLNDIINITFSEALDSTTINTSNFGLRHSESNLPIGITVSYNSTTFIVTLTPETHLWKNSTFKVTVVGLSSALGTGNVKASDASDFATTTTWTFITGDDIDAGIQKTDTVEDREGDTRLPIGLTLSEAAPFTLVSTKPSNGSWGFTGASITLTFNKGVAIAEAAANIEIFQRPFLDEEGWLAQTGSFGTGLEWDQGPFTVPVWGVDSSTTGGIVTLTTTGVTYLNCAYEVVCGSDMISSTGDDLDSNYSVSFTSESYPKYVTPITVRNEMFQIYDTLNLEFLHQVVWKWMIDGFRISGANTTQFTLQSKGKYIKDYAKYGSVMDVMESLFMKKSLLAGTSKTLGDFTVSYHPTAGDLGKNSVYTQMKAKFDRARRAISYQTHSMRVFIKGWNSGLDPINFKNRLWKNPDVVKNYDGQVRPSHLPIANTVAQRKSKLPE